MFMHEWNKGKYIFRDIHKFGFPYYHIHPYKQKVVKYLIDNKADWVDFIIIFGSALHPGHFYKKDLDVCLIGNLEGDFNSSFMKIPGTMYDFIREESFVNLKLKAERHVGSVYYRIVKEGVMVYENLLVA